MFAYLVSYEGNLSYDYTILLNHKEYNNKAFRDLIADVSYNVYEDQFCVKENVITDFGSIFEGCFKKIIMVLIKDYGFEELKFRSKFSHDKEELFMKTYVNERLKSEV